MEVTTVYVPSRRGARPSRRITRGASAGTPAEPALLAVDEPSRRALLLLHRARAREVQRISEPVLRKAISNAVTGAKAAGIAAARTVAVGPAGTLALIDSLIAMGVLERHENLDRQGNVRNSFLRVTPAGETILESLFGPISRDSLAELAQRLEEHLQTCQRPEVAALFTRQAGLLRSGRPPALDLGDAGTITFAPRQDDSSYVKIIDFFGFLGSRPQGEVWDYKEISGRLFAGEKDSVKYLEGIRSKIAAVAESEIGLSLEELGVTGAHLLYWVPYHGDLRPDGAIIWGVAPAISTRDIRRVTRFATRAKTLVLIENRTALDYLAGIDAGARGWLVVCTDGMPKRGMYDLLRRIENFESMRILTWTDWDIGGLKITENLLAHLPAGTVSVVPHPMLHGRKVEVPEAYLSHCDPRISALAESVSQYGEVYQEESLSLLASGAWFPELP
ncbi:MAG: DUF2399 domain-containing protein [Ignavibacteriales bacterium]